jgi:hypothetical protein
MYSLLTFILYLFFDILLSKGMAIKDKLYDVSNGIILLVLNLVLRKHSLNASK